MKSNEKYIVLKEREDVLFNKRATLGNLKYGNKKKSGKKKDVSVATHGKVHHGYRKE